MAQRHPRLAGCRRRRRDREPDSPRRGHVHAGHRARRHLRRRLRGSGAGPRRQVCQPRRRRRGQPRRRAGGHRAGAEVCRRDPVCAGPRRRVGVSRGSRPAACPRSHRGGRAGRTVGLRPAPDQGQLPDVRRAAGGIAGRCRRRHARLDPGNAGIYRYWVQNLAAARRPREMLRVLTDFDSRFPGRLYRGEYLFAFTGSTAPWWDDVARLRAGGEPNRTLSAECNLLRVEGRLDAAADAADRRRARRLRPAQLVRVHWSVPALKPLAELRGWERLLAGDAGGAAREGAVLAAFAERLPKAAWNAWWRRLLKRGERGPARRERRAPSTDAGAALRLVGATPTFPNRCTSA